MLISKFCETDFSSYEDFKARFEIRVPENFNFAYDVMDELAATKPDARALVWCDDKGEEVTLTFGDMKRLSDKAASMFASYGIAKGDVVMTLLRSKYQYWICALALHKLGAVLVPATHQLVEKDLKYRFNAAGVKAVVAVGDARLLAAIDNVKAETPTLKHRFVVGAASEGWIDFDAAMEAASAEFVRPTGNAATTNDDLMLMYFTSGTTGMPKMVVHDFRYPLGHILTAKFW